MFKISMTMNLTWINAIEESGFRLTLNISTDVNLTKNT